MDEKRHAVDIIVDDVVWLGYSKVILKSDNEPAIIKLSKEALATLKVPGLEQAGEEHPPPYDSQANGSVENAVELMKCGFRTLKFCLERRIGKRIPPRHPIMSWLAPHAEAILRYRSRGEDGKVPNEWTRLRPFNSRLIAFGNVAATKYGQKSFWMTTTSGIRVSSRNIAQEQASTTSTASIGRLSEWQGRLSVFQISPSGAVSTLRL